MQSFDRFLFLLINAPAATPPGLIAAAAFVSNLLPALAVAGVAAGAALRPTWRRPLCAGLISMALTWLLVTLFRSSIQVPRPAALGLGVQWAVQGLRPGFPSMHASASFAFAASLAFARLGGPALLFMLLALLVAASRVFLGLHFPSDVAVGAVLGCGVAWLVCLAWRRLPARRA